MEGFLIAILLTFLIVASFVCGMTFESQQARYEAEFFGKTSLGGAIFEAKKIAETDNEEAH